MPELKDLIGYGPTVVLLALCGWFISRNLPIWKEIRLKKLEIDQCQASALAQLGTGLTQLGTVLDKVAVEQRRATESIEIMQRVNADSADRLSSTVKTLADRVEQLEEERRRAYERTGA